MLRKIFNLFRSPPHSSLFDFYYSLDFKIESRTPIEQLKFTYFDTECTGLHTKKDRILSIGAINGTLNNMNLKEHISFLVKNKQTYDAIQIHGIMDAHDTGLPEQDAIIQFMQLCGNRIIVGHFIALDVDMINQALTRMHQPTLKNKVIDTLKLAFYINNESPTSPYTRRENYSLDALCLKYGIIPTARHTADGDALSTALLFMHQLSELRQKGVKTFGQLKKIGGV